MLDFSSSLYLGLHHPSGVLRPWEQMTVGKPATLSVPIEQRRIASALARLQGCESAVLSPSTLHLFWDLFGILAKERTTVFVDSGAYPIARWGVERAAGIGTPIVRFPHQDTATLNQLLRSYSRKGDQPIIVADGFCPGCGKAAPLHDYSMLVERHAGLLVIDDTQALGLLGHSPSHNLPCGIGGGGSLRWHNIINPRILLVGSLAKAFGVPVAVLSGSQEVVAGFEDRSQTRIHCSPPSVAVLRAAENALTINAQYGDELRFQLLRNVHRFRTGMTAIGLKINGGWFPVQTLVSITGMQAEKLHDGLSRNGVKAVLHLTRHLNRACISFILTAQHTSAELKLAMTEITRLLRPTGNSKNNRQEIRHAYN